ncbi:hypothetical protein D3C80_723490 [compost metagenome]
MQAFLAQGRQQGDEDARARRADRMAQGASATMDVDLVVRQVQVLHRRQGDHGKGFVDFEQIDLGQAPASALDQLVDGADRCGGEQRRGIGERRVPMDHRQRLQTLLLGLGTAHQHQRCSTIGDRAGVGRGHRAAVAEGRLELRDLVQASLGRLLVVADQALGLALGHFDRDDLAGKTAVLDRLLRAGQRGNGEGILLLTGKTIVLGAVLGKGAHQAALVVGVFEAVEEHVVDDPAVAHAVAATGLVQQVRGVGHAFHAASHNHIGAAGQQQVVGHDRRLHARAAHLVQGGAGGALVQTGAQGRLARWRLAQACRQYAAEQHLFDAVRRYPGTLDSGADGRSTQLRRGQAFQVALQAAHGRAHGADDYDRIIGECHDCLLRKLLGSHAQGAVKTDHLTVEHAVFNDVAGQRSVFLRAAQAWRERYSGRQRIAHFLGHASHHRGFENARCDGHHTDAEARQFTGRRQGQAGDRALGGGVGGLTDLAVVGGNRGGVDDHPTLTLSARFAFGHGCSGQAQQVEAADQVDVDHPAEAVQAMGAILAQDLFGADDTGAVDQAMETAERGNGGIDRGLGGALLTDIGNRKVRLATQRLGLGSDRLGIEVDQHHLGSSLDEHLCGSGAQPGSCAADDEVLVGNLHDGRSSGAGSRSQRGLLFGYFLVAQDETLQLAARGLGQLADEFDFPWIGVGIQALADVLL